MPHHVITTLPDGRAVRVDHRQPVVKWLRRIHAEIQKPISKRNHDKLEEADLAAAAWLDANPDKTCTAEQVRHGTCTIHD